MSYVKKRFAAAGGASGPAAGSAAGTAGSASASGTSAVPGFGKRRNMGAPTEKPKDGGKTLRRLLAYFASHRTAVILLFFVVTATVLLRIAAPAYLSRAIDAITMRTFDKLPQILLIMITLYVTSSACNLLEEYLGAKLSQKIVKGMRADLFRKTIDLPVGYLDTHSHGDLISRMTNDAENISNVVSSSLTSLFSGLLTLVGTVAIMLSYSWQLTLLSCSVIIFSVLFTRFLSRYIRKLYVKRQRLLGALNGIVNEKVTNYKTVTAYNQQDSVVDDFNGTSNELTRTGILSEILSSSMGPVMNMLNNVSFVVVAVFGEKNNESGEGHSRSFIGLRPEEISAIDAIKASGKPFVAVLMNGRPLAIPELAEKADAILEGWFLGSCAGEAIADIMSGARVPTGRLTVDFPRTTGACPVYYNRLPTGRPSHPNGWMCNCYIDSEIHTPQYPFGFGLGYSEIAYSGEKVEVKGDAVVFTATVANRGAFAAEETVQAYVRDLVGAVSRPKRELKGFAKVALAPGESKTVEISVPRSRLVYHAGARRLDAEGKMQGWIAPDSISGKALDFTL